MGWRTGLVAGVIAALAFSASAQEDFPQLPGEMVAAASAFEAWTERAAGVDPAFADKSAVAHGLTAAAPMDAGELEEGMIAYGALAALGEPRFVEGVREASRYGDLGARLANEPYAVSRVDGAAEAAARVDAALGRRGAAVLAAGAKVKQAAYSIQHQAWSRAMVADAAARLAALKTAGVTPVSASPEDVQRARASLAAADGPDAARLSPLAADALALAALAILREPAPPTLTSEPASAQCLKMARLNLYQCMAVAGPQYEDVFCLGEHALKEAGACLVKAAGGAP